MVVAFELLAVHHPQMQRDLPMGAAVLEREYLSAGTPIEHNGQRGKAAAQRLPHLQFLRPSKRIPVVGVCAYVAQVDCGG